IKLQFYYSPNSMKFSIKINDNPLVFYIIEQPLGWIVYFSKSFIDHQYQFIFVNVFLSLKKCFTKNQFKYLGPDVHRIPIESLMLNQLVLGTDYDPCIKIPSEGVDFVFLHDPQHHPI